MVINTRTARQVRSLPDTPTEGRRSQPNKSYFCWPVGARGGEARSSCGTGSYLLSAAPHTTTTFKHCPLSQHPLS